MSKKRKIGDIVWYPEVKTVAKKVPCPDCFGDKKLTVILGDGSRVRIDCAGCTCYYVGSPDHLTPTGYVAKYTYEVNSRRVEVTGIKISRDGTAYEYDGHRTTKEIFDTKEEADAAAKRIAKKMGEDALERFKYKKEKDRKTWAWNVTYHRRKIKHAREKLDYHSKKLGIALEKTKEGKEDVL